MPDATWDDKPFARNALGISNTSELWLDGEVVSKAEMTRMKKPVVPMAAAQALQKVANERGAEAFDPAFWSWQPVGGRQVSRRPGPCVVSPARALLDLAGNSLARSTSAE
jgi:hypothetical protein